MKNNKKIISTLLIGTICIGTTLPTFANTKDETVYSKINNENQVYSTIVSDKISNDNNDELIKDITNLLNIENTGGDETFNQDGEKITWNANGSNIQYKGETNEKLPITCNVKYELDGEEVEAKDIVGKEGKVKITLEYTNNEEHNVNINGKSVKMYTPFVVVAGTIINNENNSNIKISSGKIIDNGDKTIAIGLAMPGLQDSLAISKEKIEIPSKIELEMDAKDFEMNNIISYAKPKLLESNDIEIFDNLDEIYNQVNTLQSSSKQLVSGANQLNEGASELNKGANTLAEGINSAYSGASTIKTSVEKSTQSLLDDKSEALDKNTVSSIGTSASNMAVESIKEQSTSIEAEASKTATKTISNKLGSIGDKASKTAVDTIKSNAESIGDTAKATAEKEMNNKLETIGNNASMQVKNIKLTTEEISYIKNQVKLGLEKDATYAALPEKTQAIILQYSQSSAISAAQTAAQTTATTVASQVAQSTALQIAGTVASQTAQSTALQVAGTVASQTAQSTALQVAGEVAGQTAQSTASQVAGTVASQTAQSTASQVANQVKGAALNKVASQMKTLSSGLSQLTDGLSQINTGAETLTDGTTSLEEGANTLAEGMIKFDEEGIEKICNYINGDIKDLTNRIEILKDLADDYKTFTRINDNDNGTVKFITVIDSVKKENYAQNINQNNNMQDEATKNSMANKENETSGKK